MPRRLPVFIFAFAVWSCRPAPLFVPAPADGLLAVLSLDARGGVVAVRARYGSWEQAETVEASPEATDVVILRLSEAALREAVDDFDASRANETTILARSTCAPGRSADGRSREISLPPSTVFEVAHLADALPATRPVSAAELPALQQAVISAPILSQRCPVEGTGAIVPFSSGWSALGRRATIAGQEWLDDRIDSHISLGDWVHVVALDKDHLLVHGLLTVAVLERGVSYEGQSVPSTAIPLSMGNISNLIVERHPDGEPLAIWAIGGVLGGAGFILEVRVDGSGPHFVGTSTRVPAKLEDGSFDADGNFLAIGGRNDVPGEPTSGFVIELMRSPPSRRSFEIPSDPLTALRRTQIAGKPHIVGTDGGAVYIGDIWNGPQRLQVNPNSTSAIAGIAVVGTDIWVTTLRSGMHRKRLNQADFSPVVFEIPVAYGACAGGPDACDRLRQLGGRVESLNPGESTDGTVRLYSSSNGCTGGLAIRAADGCLAAFPDRDRPFELNGGRGWRASTVHQSHVFFVGRDGTVGDLAL